MSEGKMVSPNDLQQAAKDHMLQGCEPVTKGDWALCANFWAANIALGLEESAVPLIGMIFQCPLSKAYLIEIARFQANKKEIK